MSAESPYRRVLLAQRRRAARAEGTASAVARSALSLALVVALIPLVRPVFLGFLDLDPSDWGPGLAAVWWRAGLLSMCLIALEVHARVLRGPDRAVLTLHPVDPVRVVRAEIEVVLRSRLAVLLAVVLVLAPVGLEVGWLAFVLGALIVAGAAVVSLVTSTVVLLYAIEAAESAAWAPWLDLLRGNNPRPQAAIIYALAPSTFVGGWLALAASDGAVAVLAGEPTGWVWVGLPFVVAGLSWPLVPRAAAGSWFRANLVLSDIAARYATVERQGERESVYMDWTVRFLPTDVARWALLDLRHGWRERRGVVSVLWLVTVIAMGLGWTEDPAAGGRAALAAGVGAFLVGAVPVMGARDEPPFLRLWLPSAPLARAVARAWAVLAWSAAPVVLAAIALTIRQGPGAGGRALLLGALVSLLAATTAALMARPGRHAVSTYGGVSVLLLALASYAVWGGAT